MRPCDCTVKVLIQNPLPRKCGFGKLNLSMWPKFKNDLRNSELLLNTSKHLADLSNCFSTTLQSIIDKHAP